MLRAAEALHEGAICSTVFEHRIEQHAVVFDCVAGAVLSARSGQRRLLSFSWALVGEGDLPLPSVCAPTDRSIELTCLFYLIIRTRATSRNRTDRPLDRVHVRNHEHVPGASAGVLPAPTRLPSHSYPSQPTLPLAHARSVISLSLNVCPFFNSGQVGIDVGELEDAAKAGKETVAQLQARSTPPKCTSTRPPPFPPVTTRSD